MDRGRGLLLALVVCLLATGDAAAQSVEVLVQSSLTAGLRYHEAKEVWDHMREGDLLTLAREPANPHDANAVRVEWQGHMLGYLPRADNEAVARQLDRGNRLQARIVKLTRYRNHRRKLELEVFLPM